MDTIGGDVRRAELLTYPVAPDKPEQPVRLLSDVPAELFVAQSGLLSSQTEAPSHRAQFTAEATEYRLQPNADEVRVPLRWTGSQGLQVTKTYVFHRNSYAIDVIYELENTAASPWTGHLYRQLQRVERPDQASRFIYTYTGAVVYSPEIKYEKVSFDDMREEPLNRDLTGGWAAMIQHYFLAAWVPEPDKTYRYYSNVVDGSRYVIGMMGPDITLPADGKATIESRLVVGPKLQDHLAEIAPGLELTVDYGMLTVIAQPLFWLLSLIYKIVGNWGWAIVLLTVLIKLAFYKLSETSYRSMANMRKLQPRLQALKERYGDDRQRLNQAMMELYKKEKINPLGGCLPILVQIPVFIALYWVLLESVEMRQAEFILWLNDLSAPDPYYVLPLIMGVSMLLQQKLNPSPLDPIQQRIMMILPIVFTVFFAFFPAGLVLYWVVNNILSIAQQWVITRRIEAGAKA
ncbi:MAG: membrane protein insertase YidC [Gammaproteobacteria bacterium]